MVKGVKMRGERNERCGDDSSGYYRLVMKVVVMESKSSGRCGAEKHVLRRVRWWRAEVMTRM